MFFDYVGITGQILREIIRNIKTQTGQEIGESPPGASPGGAGADRDGGRPDLPRDVHSGPGQRRRAGREGGAGLPRVPRRWRSEELASDGENLRAAAGAGEMDRLA